METGNAEYYSQNTHLAPWLAVWPSHLTFTLLSKSQKESPTLQEHPLHLYQVLVNVPIYKGLYWLAVKGIPSKMTFIGPIFTNWNKLQFIKERVTVTTTHFHLAPCPNKVCNMKLQLKHNMNFLSSLMFQHILSLLDYMVNMLITPRLLWVGVNLGPLCDVYDRSMLLRHIDIEIYYKKLWQQFIKGYSNVNRSMT